MKAKAIIKAAAAAATAISFAGCANLVIRPQLDYNEGPYFCTEQVGRMIDDGWNGDALAKALLPALVADWPLDAVADTLMFPYDFVAYRIRRHSWRVRQRCIPGAAVYECEGKNSR